MTRITRACFSFAALLTVSGLAPAEAQPMRGPYGGSPQGYTSPSPEDAALGKQLAAKKCAACHGPDGNSPVPQFPKIAGQNPAYFYDQLLAFKTGARPSQAMAQAVAGLSGADAINLAWFYSEQPVRPDPVTERDLARLGEQIFFERGPGSPPCAICHAADGGRMGMMGMMGGGAGGPVPNLNGQHAAYTLEQLNQYAADARPDGVMNRVAAALTESERRAVAEYLAGSP